jgi:myosin heavy subunit
MEDYENLLKNLLYIRAWGPLTIEEQKGDDLPRLERALLAVKKYVGNGDIDEVLEIINEYKKKSKITRGFYFDSVKKKISQKAYGIASNGEDVIYKMIPELKPDERILLLDTLQKFLKIRRRFLVTLENDRLWQSKSEMLLDEMNSYIEEIENICPWIRLTTSYELYWRQRFLTHSKSGLSSIISNGYAVARKVMKKCNIGEEEIKKFSYTELEAEIEENRRIIEELGKKLAEKEEENKSLAKQLEDLKTEKKKIEEELDLKKKEIKRVRDTLEERNRENLRLSSEIEELQKKLDEVKLNVLPIDAQTEIREKNKMIKEITQTLKLKEEYIRDLEKKLAEKEKEIEEKGKEVKFYPCLREEDLASLDKAMDKLALTSTVKKHPIGEIILKYKDAYSIFEKIYFLRKESGEVDKEDLEFLKIILNFSDVLEKQPSDQQPDEFTQKEIRELYAKYTKWRKHIETQRKIEKEFSHL